MDFEINELLISGIIVIDMMTSCSKVLNVLLNNP